MSKFGGRLAWIILSLVVLILARLVYVAYESNNWTGLIFSAIHVILIALTAFFALYRTDQILASKKLKKDSSQK